jgi:hypothetical protein
MIQPIQPTVQPTLDARAAGAGRKLARVLQHHPATLFAGLSIAGTRGVADKQHGVWRSGNRYALPTSPHPRRRLLELRKSCATLSHPTAQKIGHSNCGIRDQLRSSSRAEVALPGLTGWPMLKGCAHSAALRSFNEKSGAASGATLYCSFVLSCAT